MTIGQNSASTDTETRRRAKRTRLALLVVFAVNGAIMATWASRIPAIKQAAGLSNAQLGLALLAPGIGALAAFELSGRAAARFGSAAVTGVCAAAFCLLLPIVAIADTGLVALFSALLIFGAGNGALDVSMNTHGVTAEWALGRPALSGMHAAFSAGGLLGAAAGFAAGVFAAAGFAGAAFAGAGFAGAAALLRAAAGRVGAAAGGAAAAAGIGIRTNFISAAAVGLACTLLAGRWLPLNAGPTQTVANSRDETPRSPRRRGVAKALPMPVLLLGAVGFACLLGEGAAADWSATYLRESVGTSAGLAAVGYAGFSAAMLTGRLFGDTLRSRVRAARLLPISAALAALGLLVGLVAGGAAAGIAGFTVLGAGLAVVIPIVFAAAGQLHPDRTGLPAPISLARVNTLSYLGFLAGPPLVGAVAQLTGLRAALLIPAGLAAAVVPLARRALAESPERSS